MNDISTGPVFSNISYITERIYNAHKVKCSTSLQICIAPLYEILSSSSIFGQVFKQLFKLRYIVWIVIKDLCCTSCIRNVPTRVTNIDPRMENIYPIPTHLPITWDCKLN